MSEENNLDIRTSRHESACVIELAGEVDMRSAPALRDELLEVVAEAPRKLILDLSEVPYIDSSGVGTIVELKRRVEKSGAKIVLVGLQPRVRSVFEITRLGDLLTVEAD